MEVFVFHQAKKGGLYFTAVHHATSRPATAHKTTNAHHDRRTRQQPARQKQAGADDDVTVLVLASLRRSQAPVLRGLVVSWRAGREGSLRVTQDARRVGQQRVLACAKDASPSTGQPHAWRQGGGGRAYLVLGVLALLAFELLALKLGVPVRCTMGQVHAEEL